MKTVKKVEIIIAKDQHRTWSDSFNKNIEALQWAIDNAPLMHTTALMDTLSVINGIIKKV